MIDYALEFEEEFPINKPLLETQKYDISADPLLVRVKRNFRIRCVKMLTLMFLNTSKIYIKI